MLAGCTPRIVTEPCSPMRLLSHCFFFVQHNHVDSITVVGALYLVRPVLATPTRAFVPDALLGLANLAHASAHRWLDCIDFGIDPPVPTPSASIASSHFFYVNDGLDCIDFGIAPLPRRLPRRVSVIIMAPLARLQLHRHGNPTTTTSTSAIFSTASSTTAIAPSRSATSTSAQRATALHEDSSASSPATSYAPHRLL
ncbi:unnamed protein product [Miscanthus lutarioriparius]|uniref:Uncharacterized protein n=1 Tax=Miscanthus lutarioriparius TaxID=422564 RepID=A0A811PKD9_9POAL|nr:unnamed protein product [Miscanthus lutarioriparius]